MLNFFRILVISLGLLTLSNQPISASSDYHTTFTSTYSISPEVTQVRHEIILKNRTKHLYLREYVLQLGSTNLENIRTFQDNLPILNDLSATSNNTTVTLPELNPVVGLDQSTSLVIEYDTTDIAETLKRTWSINIPRLTRANEIDEFVRIVKIPSDLGLPTTEFPRATNMTLSDDSKQTILTYNGYPNNSLSLLFGESEYYHLNLTYHIANPTLSAADTEIALPPETAYQNVIFQSLSPKPRNVRVDPDGNWLAIYPLKSKENLTVEADLYLEVFASPQHSILVPNPAPYTSEQKYWELHSNSVASLADQLSSPESIYDYLVENFSYDHTRAYTDPVRLGADAALSNPRSVICTEFADTFVALARAKGIPSRVVNGFAYSTNPNLRPLDLEKDLLHAWVEYYDQAQQKWMQLDPTWGHTTGGIDYFHKLDYNHLTFSILGIESAYPLPAGSYKNDPSQKTIMVELVDSLPPAEPKLESVSTDNQTIITNTGNVSVVDEKVGFLPPYASVELHSTLFDGIAFLPRLVPLLVFAFLVVIIFLLIKRFKSN